MKTFFKPVGLLLIEMIAFASSCHICGNPRKSKIKGEGPMF